MPALSEWAWRVQDCMVLFLGISDAAEKFQEQDWHMKVRPIYEVYWGKAQALQQGNSPECHLLCYHGLDVAAVGVQYLKSATSVNDFFREGLGESQISREDLATWVGFFLALHDLGKFADAFQGQRSDIYARLSGRTATTAYRADRRHDSLGWWLWEEEICELLQGEGWFDNSSRSFRRGLHFWARAVTGHHGEPPKNSTTGFPQEFRPQDKEAVLAYLNALRDIFPVEVLRRVASSLPESAFCARSRQLSWWLAGVAVLSDWLGSNRDFFPYCDQSMTLGEYWEKAQCQAADALKASGVLPLPIQPVTLQDLFPFIRVPSPLQQWAQEVDIPSVAQIHLLEDVTGAGKTEAAIMLAQRIMASGVADGFYIGLPTMATANAMYRRVAEVYRLHFSGDASLVLASSQRLLVEAFAASVLPASAPENDFRQQDDTATARCTHWLADHNKRALLAPAGVGTVDQAMLATLCSRHQSLRLLGLFRKVLIIDEVHACDAYMQTILKNLLTFHAAAGGSVILLSATLTQAMKQKLLEAFVRGATWNETDRPVLHAKDFPLATSWDSGRKLLVEAPIATRPDVRRQLSIRYTSMQEEVVQHIRAELAAGKCVCWIRNTVADAMAAHALFVDSMSPADLILFHARFALRDRLDTEERILTYFGKNSRPADRRGKLVVATQVVEQSLDADWDVMVTDIAPVDLLIQRAGRLQRHPRNLEGERLSGHDARDERGPPCLWVYGPEWTQVPDKDWFRRFSRGAAMVYESHGEIWRTAKVLQEGVLRLPDDARRVIDTVFEEGAEQPEALAANATQVQGKESADQSLARMGLIVLDEGYQAGGGAWRDELKAMTRTGEPTTTVVLARWKNGEVVPWVQEDGMRPYVAWAYSSLNVASRLINGRIPQPTEEQEVAVQKVMQTLPDKGRWSVLLVLEGDGPDYGVAAVGGTEKRKAIVSWRYSAAYGLAASEG